MGFPCGSDGKESVCNVGKESVCNVGDPCSTLS